MSAFLCSNKHLTILAEYAAYVAKDRLFGLQDKSLQNIGTILYNANIKSLQARYPDHAGVEVYDTFVPDVFGHNGFKQTPVAIAKLANCYDYQACEASDYHESLAKTIITAIKETVLRKLEGYEDADYSI